MNRGKKLLTGLLLVSLFLVGCSRDSKIQVVEPKKQKDKSLLVKESEGSLGEQIQAPVRYQRDTESDGFHLLANARVIVPDVEGIKLKKIRSRIFTGTDMENIQEVLFRGEQLYTPCEDLNYQENGMEIAADGKEFPETEPAEEFPEAEAGKDFSGTEPSGNEEQVFDGKASETNNVLYDGQLYGTESIWEEEEPTERETQMLDQNALLYYGNVPETAVQIEPQVPKTYEEARVLLKDFLDRKKTFTYSSQDDFTILSKLFSEPVEYTDGWMEKKKMEALQLLCEEFADMALKDLYIYCNDLLQSVENGYHYGIVLPSEALYSFYMSNSGEEMEGIEMILQRLDIEEIPETEMKEYWTLYQKPVSYHEDNLSDLDLQQQSNELMKKLGLGHVELMDIQEKCLLYNWNWEDSEVLSTRGLSYVYTQVVDGVPITQVNNGGDFQVQEDGMINWPCERISATFGREGLVGFQWSSPATVEDWHDDYAFLLPFSEIQKIFEELLTSRFETGNGVAAEGEITISEVRLGYAKVVSKDLIEEDTNVSVEDGIVTYTGVLVPAWDFIGPAYGTTAELYGVADGTQISYMTINATDGSIIQR